VAEAGMAQSAGGLRVVGARRLFFNLAGGSIGLQIGASKTDFVLLFMNGRGAGGLLKDKFEIGGEGSATAGPVGRSTSASTDLLLKAGIISYSRSKGLFAGLELKGTVISPDNDDNVAVYGMKSDQILSTHSAGQSQRCLWVCESFRARWPGIQRGDSPQRRHPAGGPRHL